VEDIQREADDTVRTERVKEREQTRQAVSKTQSRVEKATMGDLDVFSQLKQQLGSTPPPPPPPAPKKEAVVKEEPKVEEVAPVAEEPKVEEPKAEKPKAPKAAAPSDKDQLRKVEGIGPKIEELFHNSGILTFSDLAGSDVEKLKEILADAGSRYRMHDPTTWPEQSKMAAEGKWDELKAWQDNLKGGK